MIRMPSQGAPAAAPLAATDAPGPANAATQRGPAAAAGRPALQSAVLGPALAALQQMPEIDGARAAELRDALARGELPFDAAKLAGLIQRFHGGRP